MNLRHAASASSIQFTTPSSIHNVSFSRLVGTLDGSIHFSSDGQDEETEYDAYRDKAVRSDPEDIAMTDFAHRKLSSGSVARSTLKQQGPEFRLVDV